MPLLKVEQLEQEARNRRREWLSKVLACGSVCEQVVWVEDRDWSRLAHSDKVDQSPKRFQK